MSMFASNFGHDGNQNAEQEEFDQTRALRGAADPADQAREEEDEAHRDDGVGENLKQRHR